MLMYRLPGPPMEYEFRRHWTNTHSNVCCSNEHPTSVWDFYSIASQASVSNMYKLVTNVALWSTNCSLIWVGETQPLTYCPFLSSNAGKGTIMSTRRAIRTRTDHPSRPWPEEVKQVYRISSSHSRNKMRSYIHGTWEAFHILEDQLHASLFVALFL